jgi:HEAT repeat protein
VRLAALLVVGCLAQDLDGLEKVLRSGGDPARRKVVQQLATMKSAEAWELLIGALEDEEPMVADEAQLQLREMPSPEVLELALGKAGLKSRKELVRLRVAEALGRVELKLDADLFARPLRDKDPAVRRALYWSLQRVGERDGFAGPAEAAAELLRSALEDEDDPGARAAAVVALGACAGPGEALIAAALEHEQAQTRAAAVLVASQLEMDGALKWIPRLSKDPDPGVRTVAAEALAEITDSRAALALVWQLEQETQLRRKWRVVELLQGMSGKKFRLDPRPWRDWADGLPLEWTGPERKRQPDHGQVSAAFAGLPILSDRVAFLIDLSGSIWEERSDGRTRKEVVDGELRKALESLPADARFLLVPYTAEPLPWKDEMVDAGPRNVAKALAWFEKRKDYGTGNFWDALMLALEDPEVDTIVSLSDGGPSGGQRWNLELMKELYREHNRFRRVPIDAILVDRKGWLVEQWKEMCAVSGGRVHSISLE